MNLAQLSQPIFFDGWTSLGRIAISAVFVFIVVVLLIRITGKRITSKMNNFDWIVTVAVGSIVASAILLKDVVVLDALVAIGALFAIQYTVTRASVLSERAEDAVKAEPTLLFREGLYLEAAMANQRVTQREVNAAVRSAGIATMADVAAVILETNANFSVIPRSATDTGHIELLAGVDGAAPRS